MTNYNKFATQNPNLRETSSEVKKEIEPKTDAQMVAEQEEVTVTESAKVQSGTIVDCDNLNIRKEPTTNANNVVGILGTSDEFDVFPDESTDDWYKVKTKDHVEGFCMKQFISLM